MSKANLDLALQLRAKDYASKVVKSMSENLKKSSKDIEQQAKKTAQTEQREIQKTTKITEQHYRQISQMARTTATSRQDLGVRSERAIQQEIARTQQAYTRLKSSGMATGRELSRAHEAMTAKIKALNGEMSKLSAGQKMANIGRGIAGVAAGVTAGAMYLREPVRRQMTFDRQLAMVSNTAFSDRDATGRISGKKELFDAVEKSVKAGGGTKEDALSTIDTLLASGAVKTEIAMNLLPTLQKAGVATGASPEDIAKIAISSMQQFGIKEEDIGQVLDMAVAAGQAGNFELKDMARWLPQQMAAGKSIGLNGLDGLRTLLVANQQARVTAGTSDEAGNNLVNLLAKISSKDTNERFSKLEYKGKDGKTHGIDFIKSMERYKAAGQDSLTAFMSIMDKVIGNDDNYKALQAKLKTAKTSERAALINQMTDLVQGTAIGEIISDRQALMALLGIRNNVDLGKEVRTQVDNSAGAVNTSHQVVKATNDYKVDDVKNAAEFAQMKSLEGLSNKIGDVSESLTNYANKYPELTTALVGASTAIAALGTAAAGAAGTLALLGGLKGKMGGVGASAIGVGDKIKSIGGGRLAKFGGLAVTGLMLAAEGYDTYKAGADANDERLATYKNAFVNGMKRDGDTKQTYVYTPQMYAKTNQTTPTINYHGGYQIAALQQSNKIARTRLDNGTLTEDQYRTRVAINQANINSVMSQGQNLKTQINDMTGAQERISQALKNSLSQNIRSFGNTISDGLKRAVSAQEHKIENRITIELDGRIIGEQVSEMQYNELKRG
ncbi:phage tail tape measure protein [Actinobacillus sp. GY-402]|nr:phage tail tape measure protein [Actinobacillus sp. GY-402]